MVNIGAILVGRDYFCRAMQHVRRSKATNLFVIWLVALLDGYELQNKTGRFVDGTVGILLRMCHWQRGLSTVFVPYIYI